MEIKLRNKFYNEELGLLEPGVYVIPNKFREPGNLPKAPDCIILDTPTEGDRARINRKVVEITEDDAKLAQADLDAEDGSDDDDEPVAPVAKSKKG